MSVPFGPEQLLDCYRRGVFPMADARDDPNLFIIDPDARGILPLDRFHIPRRLKRTLKQDPFRVSCNEAFTRVVECCAEPTPSRPTTWINSAILNLYASLHKLGYAHSIECWDDDQLVGGLYGVSIGAAFFGESMFSRQADASKIALVYLVARLIRNGYHLLDAQFYNSHLEQFGIEELGRKEFKRRLRLALGEHAEFHSSDEAALTGAEAVHLITQTS